MKNNILNLRDKEVNWHPYTQMKGNISIPIIKGKGLYLYDNKGNRYMDAISSWWVNLHGHCHEYINKKIINQLNNLEQVIYAGFTHIPAIELSEKLLQILPNNQSKVFYSDNGSTSVEVALKMCIQYNYNKKIKKNKILAFTNAYHGDTFGAMSVSSRGTWTMPFGEYLFEVIFIDIPNSYNIEKILLNIEKYFEEICCFIYEPLVQGAAGMIMYSSEMLSILLNYCKKKGILLIQDEVFVGFGRTGKLFAAEYINVDPDIICLSKGLTGGTMPLGVTTCTNKIYEAFYSDNKKKIFFHGHSFTANPIACVSSIASIELLLLNHTKESINNISINNKLFCDKIKDYDKVLDVRTIGTILAVEYKTQYKTSYFNLHQKKLYNFFISKGIIIRPLGNIVYIVPPYCINEEELNYIYQCIIESFDLI